MKFKQIVTCLCVCGIAGGSNAAMFTFDTDVEGWTRGRLGSSFASTFVDTVGPAIHDPAGNIVGSDHDGGYAYHFSPDLGGGYGGAYGESITFDFRSAASGLEDPLVVLMSGTDYIILEHTVNASAGFLPYSFAVDTSNTWYYNSSDYFQGGAAVVASAAQIQGVLSDLRHIGISTDIASGPDTTWTDNVSLVPEPSAFVVLGGTLTMFALGRMRRTRR